MSLDWSLNRIKDYETVCWIPVAKDYEPGYMESLSEDADGNLRKMNSVTYVIIMSTMLIGMGDITEKNLEEVVLRLELWQDVNGAMMRRFIDGKSTDVRVTPADLQRHIGLSTNVGKESWTWFAKRLRAVAERRVKQALEVLYDAEEKTAKAV